MITSASWPWRVPRGSPRRQIPELHDAIDLIAADDAGSGRKRFAIGREFERADRIQLGAEGAVFLPGFHIPQLHALVRSAAGRSQRLTVGRECHAPDGARLAVQRGQRLSIGRVPDPDRRIGTAGGQHSAVRRIGQRIHVGHMAGQGHPVIRMTFPPQVVPFEGSQILLVELGAMPLQQFQGPGRVACFPRLLGEVDVGGIQAAAGQQFRVQGQVPLDVGQVPLFVGLNPLLVRFDAPLNRKLALCGFVSLRLLGHIPMRRFLALGLFRRDLRGDRFALGFDRRLQARLGQAISIRRADRLPGADDRPHDQGSEHQCRREERHAIPPRKLAEAIRGRGGTGLYRLIVQIPRHVRGKCVGRFVAAVAILLQRLHHDPVKFASHQVRELRRLHLPLGRDRSERFA